MAWPIDQRVDLVGALIREDRLQVGHVTDHRVFEGDPVGAEDGARRAGNLERIAHVVELAEADLLRSQGPIVLAPPEMQRHQGPPLHRHHHLDQLLLGQLERGDRPVELVPLDRIVESGFVTGRAAPIAPNAILNLASLRHESGPRIDDTPGEDEIVGNSDVVEDQLRGDRSTKRRLLPDLRRREPQVSVGIRNPRTSSSVRAQTTAKSAMDPLVIHILVPLITQSDPSRRALVLIDAGSEPESGSVRPKQPMISPLPSGGAMSASAPRSRTSRSGT